MNGKGDKDRTTNREAYRAHFDEIDWRKKVIEPNTVDPTYPQPEPNPNVPQS